MADDNAETKTVVAQKEPETFSREYVTELREEAKSHRLKAHEAEKAAQEKADALAKAEKAAAEKITEADKKANERIIRAELKAAAIKSGMIDLDFLKLADLSEVKLLDNGDLEGADALMEKMKKAKPHLFNTGRSSSNTDQEPPKKNTEAKHARDMTDEERAAAKAAYLKGSR